MGGKRDVTPTDDSRTSVTRSTSNNKELRHEEREKSQQAGKPRAAIEEKSVEDEAVAAPLEVNKIPS